MPLYINNTLKGVMFILTFVNYLISLYNYIQGDNMDIKIKNKVVDYVTPTEACQIIGISEKSTALITRWINDGKIKGTFKFGNNTAIPITWVKSECLTRNIDFKGIITENKQIPVSLKDYEPLINYAIGNNLNYATLHSQFKRGTFQGDYIRFGNAYGIRK